MRVAILDDKGRLVGTRTVKNPKPDDVDAGDLPADGRYRWDAKAHTFIPIGHGFGKPGRPSVDRDRALYLFMRAVMDGKPAPQECRDWLAWYERNHEVDR